MPVEEEGAKWPRGHRVTRNALMARRAQSNREGAACDEAPNGYEGAS